MIETKFKHTDIGPIPQDWELRRLEEILSPLPNNTFARDKLGNNGIFQDIHYGDILTIFPSILDVQKTDVPYIIAKDYSPKHLAVNGDVIFADTAEDSTVGRCIELINLGQNKVTSGLHTIWCRPKITFAIPFLGFALNAPMVQDQITSYANGVKVSSISKKNFAIVLAAYPKSIKEQERIGRALKDVDTLIDGLQDLIAKKRAIKQGAMSQLLSGKLRLPGFTEPWKEEQLSSIGSFYKGKGISRSEANSGDIPAIRYGEIYTFHNDYVKTFASHISKSVANNSFLLKKGDICFSGSGETLDEIGKAVAVPFDIEAYAGGDIVILRPKTEINPVFLGCLLNMPYVASQKAMLGNGVSIMHISAQALGNVIIRMPNSLLEQTAIADTLTAMDTEIEALEVKLGKYRQVKKGMMQQLLTGKIRLI